MNVDLHATLDFLGVLNDGNPNIKLFEVQFKSGFLEKVNK